MSFSEEDKEALGEDLDEIKESLKSINRISKDLRTLVTMAWVYIILSVIAGVLIGIGIGIS
jgi:F0F1-type ATP synthase assembly protein I